MARPGGRDIPSPTSPTVLGPGPRFSRLGSEDAPCRPNSGQSSRFSVFSSGSVFQFMSVLRDRLRVPLYGSTCPVGVGRRK